MPNGSPVWVPNVEIFQACQDQGLEADIVAALELAAYYVHIAQTELYFMAIQKDPQVRTDWWNTSAWPTCELYFGAYSEDRFWHVYEVFNLVKHKMLAGLPSQMNIRCDTDHALWQEACITDNASAFTLPPDIVLCPNFWDGWDVRRQAQILLHEFLHFILTLDHQHHEDVCPESSDYCSSPDACRNLATQAPAVAVQNVDNFAWFGLYRSQAYDEGLCIPSLWK